jgi:hypothetical protein
MPTSSVPPAESKLEPLHRLHSYCARFPSEIAETAIQEYTRRGDSVYDPFCGSGTSLTAGLVLGRRVVGSDINVLAGMLSSVKCRPACSEEYRRWRARFDKRLERAFATVSTHWSGAIKPLGRRTESASVDTSLREDRFSKTFHVPRAISGAKVRIERFR